MGFERYSGQRGPMGKPKASLWKMGQIYVNRAFFDAFPVAQGSSVILFYDRERNRIGFRVTPKADEPGAVKILKRAGGGMINIKGFSNYYGIRPPAAVRCDVRHDEKLDLFVLEPESAE
jgi:hypothetical protein